MCLVGLWLSIVLEQIHFRIHTDPTFHRFCAIDRKVNCDIVAHSPYSVFFGVPVAAWGIFAYAVALLVSLWGLIRRSPLAVGPSPSGVGSSPSGRGCSIGSSCMAIRLSGLP
jgi:uncharacterized membrane protein